MKDTIDNTPELRDALFHAICLLDHAKPETDTDHRDVAAARELSRLRDSLSQPTAKETTRRMIEAAKAKHGGKRGGRAMSTLANSVPCKSQYRTFATKCSSCRGILLTWSALDVLRAVNDRFVLT